MGNKDQKKRGRLAKIYPESFAWINPKLYRRIWFAILMTSPSTNGVGRSHDHRNGTGRAGNDSIDSMEAGLTPCPWGSSSSSDDMSRPMGEDEPRVEKEQNLKLIRKRLMNLSLPA